MVCKRQFVERQQRKKYFKQFKLWISTQSPLFVIAKLVGVSTKTLQRAFDTYLTNPPKPKKLKTPQRVWIKVDATYFSKWGCLIVYKAGDTILYWEYAAREYDLAYEQGLRLLTQMGYIILGVTSDWHGSIVRAVQRMYPHIPHQRCLIHTQRLGESLLTQKPKTEAGQSLRFLVIELNHITSEYEKNIWSKWFTLWRKRYEHTIKERTYLKTDEGKNTWWYTHTNLRKVYRSLQCTKDHLFRYLDHRGLDKDTNGLEGEFKHLKGKIIAHSGMRKKRRMAYISWYLYFKSQ